MIIWKGEDLELTIQNLSKTYANGVQALKEVSLNMGKGMFGLLGPNGAGKSTLMRILATLQAADTGQVHLDRIDVLQQPLEVKKILGYLPQTFDFYPKDTAYAFLDHFALLKGITDNRLRKNKVEEMLKRINLWQERKKKLGTFSNGMKQRFGVAIALLGNPALIIVDEPTAGLDPTERVRFHNLLSEISENIIVLLSTHIVGDVSDLCTHMAIIDKGHIVMHEGTLHALTRLMGKIWEKEIDKRALPAYETKYTVLSTRLFAGKTFIRIYSKTNPGNGFSRGDIALEDVYFYHLKKN
jgi:ABC-2 type transport system ATP-binding protein